MSYPERLPTIVTNSFYEPFTPTMPSQEADSARDRREFVTTYKQFIYKSAGNCDVVTHNYESKI